MSYGQAVAVTVDSKATVTFVRVQHRQPRAPILVVSDEGLVGRLRRSYGQAVAVTVDSESIVTFVRVQHRQPRAAILVVSSESLIGRPGWCRTGKACP
ncbi:MAG: hypothetical protein WDO73_33620 [Ignavibacteriota bacterium]